MEISIRNKYFIRFGAIDPHAFVKFQNLHSLNITFQTKPSAADTTSDSYISDEASSGDTESSLAHDIKAIRITKNQIESLNKRVFDFTNHMNMSGIDELVLSLNSVKRIEPSSLIAFKHLKVLNLSRNKIRDLNNPKIFKGLVSLRELNLSLNSISKLDKEIFSYMTNLKLLDLSSNFIESIDKKAFRGLENLDELNLRNNCLKNSSCSHPFAYLTKLTTLNMAENQLEVINKSIFRGLTDLKHLSLYRNKIRRLEENCFRFGGSDSENIALTKLDLSANQIQRLDTNIFNSLSNLEELLLNSNQISSIEVLCFQDLKQLKQLDLSCNEIESLKKEMFLGLISLNNLVVSNNALFALEDNCFAELENLKKLDLSYNKLEELNSSNFSNLRNLEDLSIRVNNVKSVTAGTFLGLFNLKKFDLSFNKLDALERHAFSGMCNLEELKLTGNLLKILDEQSFNDLTKLKILDLSLNNLLELNSSNKHIFDMLASLEELNLVPLTKLDTRLFSCLPSLKYLHYYRYKIHILSREKFFAAMNEDFETVESMEAKNEDKCFDYEIVDYYVWAENKFK
jgi:Leucine-rich repeat (LRR) protein